MGDVKCESRTYAAEEAEASGPAPSSAGSQSLPSITTPGDARPLQLTDGQGLPPCAETSTDLTGVLSTAGEWIASQQAFLAVILARQEDAQAAMVNRPDQHGGDACRQLTIFDQIGYSSKTALESSHTERPSGESSGNGDTIPEMAPLMPARLGRHTSESGGLCLRLGPTLTVCGNYNRRGCSKTSGDGLATWCKRLLPTLCATDYKSPYSAEGYQAQALKRSKPLRDTAMHTIGIRLTPDFCEWWMGWPIGASASQA